MAKALKMEVATMEVRPSKEKQIKVKQYDSQKSFANYLKAMQKLYLLAGINRGIIPSQVTKLAESIIKMGVIRPVVVAKLSFITGKMQTYIIDGQHLFNALMRLGIKIPIVEIEIKDKQDLVEKIALLNASSKTWTMFDYITAWASLKEDYVILNKYYNIYDFELNILGAVLGEMSTSVTTKNIKRGEFKVLNEKRNVEILNHLTDALNIVPRMNRYENRYFCEEFIQYLRTEGCRYNHKKTMGYLKKNRDKFILATQEGGKIQEMLKKIK